MTTVQHSDLGTGVIHIIYNWTYANAGARTGATGFVSGDIGKVARQTDDDSLWMLTATTPTWVAVGGGGGGGTTYAYINITDEKADATSGGTFTSGAWQTRTLNTERADTGNNVTIASNQMSLLAGTYRVRITAPACYVDEHQARLRNITDSTTLLVGSRAYAGSANSHVTTTDSVIVGRFTIAATKTIEVQHRCLLTRGTDGFGEGGSTFGEVTVYTQVEMWKE